MRTNPTISESSDIQDNPFLEEPEDTFALEEINHILRREEEEIEEFHDAFPETGAITALEGDLLAQPFIDELRDSIRHTNVDTEQALERQYWDRLNIPIDYTRVERNVIEDVQAYHGIDIRDEERRRAIERDFNRTRNNWSMRYTDLDVMNNAPTTHNYWRNTIANSLNITWPESSSKNKPDPEIEARINHWKEEYIKEKNIDIHALVSNESLLRWLAKNFITTRIK